MECSYSLITPNRPDADILPGKGRERFPPDLVFIPIQPAVQDGCSVFSKEKKHQRNAASVQQIQLSDIYYGPYANGFKANFDLSKAEMVPPSLQLPRIVKGINSEALGDNTWDLTNSPPPPAAAQS